MSRRRRYREGHKGAGTTQHFIIPFNMARSEAWRSLSGAAIKVYAELRARYYGKNNGSITLSLDEGKELLHLGKTTVMRALVELEEVGFIKKTRQGVWRGRLASEFAITDLPLDGHSATRDWQHWAPPPTSKNHFIGPETGREPPAIVPPQDRECGNGSASGPVRVVSDPRIVPPQDRIYPPCEGRSGRAAPDQDENKIGDPAPKRARRTPWSEPIATADGDTFTLGRIYEAER